MKMKALYAGDAAALLGPIFVASPFNVEFGKGRTMAFASDCSPHWAAHFQPWAHYKTFWQQALRWLGAKG